MGGGCLREGCIVSSQLIQHGISLIDMPEACFVADSRSCQVDTWYTHHASIAKQKQVHLASDGIFFSAGHRLRMKLHHQTYLLAMCPAFKHAALCILLLSYWR